MERQGSCPRTFPHTFPPRFPSVHFSGGNIVHISQIWTGKVKYHEEVGSLVQFQLSLSPSLSFPFLKSEDT